MIPQDRRVDGISQQMLKRTLKTPERDDLVERIVHQIDYMLMPLGHSLSEASRHLADWAAGHQGVIAVNRLHYDASQI